MAIAKLFALYANVINVEFRFIVLSLQYFSMACRSCQYELCSLPKGRDEEFGHIFRNIQHAVV